MYWRTLRSTSAGLYVDYGHTHSGNLRGEKFQIFDDEVVKFRIDLSCNLRTRNKQVNSYCDAQSLERDIARLNYIQISEGQVFDGMTAFLNEDSTRIERDWELHLQLAEEHRIPVTLETGPIQHSFKIVVVR